MRNTYTTQEDEIIKLHAEEGSRIISDKYLSNRSEGSIRRRAHKLGIKLKKLYNNSNELWSDHNDATVDLSRTSASVYTRQSIDRSISPVNTKRYKSKRWTIEEDKLLKKYKEYGSEYIHKYILTNRSAPAIRSHASTQLFIKLGTKEA